MPVLSVPAAVVNITADGTGTSARLSWQRPEGDLDALAVKLAANGTDVWRSTLPPDATEVAVDQLTPGCTYAVVMVSSSGKLSNQSESSFRTGELLSLSSAVWHRCRVLLLTVCPAAPAAATLLFLSPSTAASAGLLLSWSPPAGRWERYRVQLLDGSQLLVDTSVNWEAVNFTFPGAGLTPGRLYRAVLVVESGGLTANSSCDGATGLVPAETPGGWGGLVSASELKPFCLCSPSTSTPPPYTTL